MGTRYDDQPPEHWAGPASLDPTPVWKQYLLVVLLLATPPALVPGDRLVLARAQADFPSGSPVRVVLGPSGPQVSEAVFSPGGGIEFREPPDWSPGQEFLWVFRISGHDYVAVSGYWRDPDTGESCPVGATLGSVRARTDPAIPAFRAFGACTRLEAAFGARGEPLTAPRGLDRYLVSVEGDRVIVNLSRTLRGFGKTPQPTRSPL